MPSHFLFTLVLTLISFGAESASAAASQRISVARIQDARVGAFERVTGVRLSAEERRHAADQLAEADDAAALQAVSSESRWRAHYMLCGFAAGGLPGPMSGIIGRALTCWDWRSNEVYFIGAVGVSFPFVIPGAAGGVGVAVAFTKGGQRLDGDYICGTAGYAVGWLGGAGQACSDDWQLWSSSRRFGFLGWMGGRVR